MKAEDFLSLLEIHGFNFYTGVPCSYLGPLIRLLGDCDASLHVAAPREDIAVGIAAGAFLAGKMPVIYMQNSGLGYCLEAFASLPLIYRIPSLVLVSYRGPEDEGWEEHAIMGRRTEDLLHTFEFRYSLFRGRLSEKDLTEIIRYLSLDAQPYVVLVTKGALQ